MSTDPRHRLGRIGERLAGEHLQRLGYEILTRNHRTRFGELDLIAFDGVRIVFCEVKTRRAPGDPFESLHPAKQRQVRKMAALWLIEAPNRPRASELRFDAIGITIDATGRLSRLEHLEGAF
ncbi:MAG: YraN family protein [Solirubrobacterales bacterium]|nr:YraN family protein [Solirubrobacterales bacterium]